MIAGTFLTSSFVVLCVLELAVETWWLSAVSGVFSSILRVCCVLGVFFGAANFGHRFFEALF